MQIDTQELVADLQRVAQDDDPPTITQYREEGKYSVTTYYNRFGSWRDAVEAAGFQPHDRTSSVPEEALITELKRISEEFERRPTAQLMNEHGKYWASTYRDHFGTWSTALNAAGFAVPGGYDEAPVERETLRTELVELADELGRRPTTDDVREYAEYSPQTYRRRFGSWADALDAAGFDPPKLTREELLQNLRDLRDEIGHTPTMREMNEQGKHSPNTYAKRFGSWSAALDAAFETANNGNS